jgi:Flp pilus assembly pilin Flp
MRPSHVETECSPSFLSLNGTDTILRYLFVFSPQKQQRSRYAFRGITMKKCTSLLKKLMKDESGQGATEYILLLVVVVALALMFRGRITEALQGKLSELGSAIGGFTVGQ